MHDTSKALRLLLTLGVVAAAAPGAADNPTWDAAVEYKLSVVVPADQKAMHKSAKSIAVAWAEVAEVDADGFEWKACRSVEFLDTPARDLNAKHVLVRRRAERGSKDSCF